MLAALAVLAAAALPPPLLLTMPPPLRAAVVSMPPPLLRAPLVPPREVAQAPPIARYEPPPYVPASTVLTFWVDSLPGRDINRAWQLSHYAASKWSAVADLDFVPARSRNEAQIIVRPLRMWDGWLGLTDVGDSRRLRQGGHSGVLGIHDAFPHGDQTLTAVLTHEFGHAIGLNYQGPPDRRGRPTVAYHDHHGNMMGPAVNWQTRLTENDVAAAVGLYGARRGR